MGIGLRENKTGNNFSIDISFFILVNFLSAYQLKN